MFGEVVTLVETFAYAVGLARGQENPDKPEAREVAGLHMLVAHAYATQILQPIRDLYARFSAQSWPAVIREDARQFLARSVDAANRFEFETRLLAPTNEAQARSSVRALQGGWPKVWVSTLRVARQTLEVVAGERPMEASYWQMVKDARTEFALTSMPVVGELVLTYEALVGREAATGRRLTDGERALAALFVLLPKVLEQVVQPVASAGKITLRALILTLDDLKVYSITKSLGRVSRSIELAVGLRLLPDKTFAELEDVLHQVNVAQRLGLIEFLNNAQLGKLNFLLQRMNDASRTAAWLRAIEKEMGAIPEKGFFQMKRAVRPIPREEAGLKLLAEQSGAAVVRLPEVSPNVYPNTRSIPGETHPDAMWRGDLVDVYSPTGKAEGSILNNAIDKQLQAPTMVVALLDDAQLTRDQVASVVSRKVWADPRASGLSRVVIVDRAGMLILDRPKLFIPPFMSGLIRMGLGDPKRLIELYKALEAESAAEGGGPVEANP